jgi:hypothetical protein
MYVNDEFAGFLIDVSKEGIMLMSESKMYEDKEYKLLLKLPSSLDWKTKITDKTFVEFTAKCIWSKKDNLDEDFYLSGYEFTQIDDENNKIINDIIEQYKTK